VIARWVVGGETDVLVERERGELTWPIAQRHVLVERQGRVTRRHTDRAELGDLGDELGACRADRVAPIAHDDAHYAPPFVSKTRRNDGCSTSDSRRASSTAPSREPPCGATSGESGHAATTASVNGARISSPASKTPPPHEIAPPGMTAAAIAV